MPPLRLAFGFDRGGGKMKKNNSSLSLSPFSSCNIARQAGKVYVYEQMSSYAYTMLVSLDLHANAKVREREVADYQKIDRNGQKRSQSVNLKNSHKGR